MFCFVLFCVALIVCFVCIFSVHELCVLFFSFFVLYIRCITEANIDIIAKRKGGIEFGTDVPLVTQNIILKFFEREKEREEYDNIIKDYEIKGATAPNATNFNCDSGFERERDKSDCKIYFRLCVIKTKELERKQAPIKQEKDNKAQKMGGKRRKIMPSVPESNDEEHDHESENITIHMLHLHILLIDYEMIYLVCNILKMDILLKQRV